jgi:hypothetical protein
MQGMVVRFTLAMYLLAAAVPVLAESPVTFSHDIAPLLYANCTACHREGEAAPFALLTYDDARKHAKQLADVATRRVMPPWKAEADSAEGDPHFIGARRLTDEQIALLKQWVGDGCTEGDPSAAPAPPSFVTGWRLGEPDMIVKMVEPYTLVAEGRDVYRCFVLPVQVPQGKYIRAVEYRPGNRRIVHHALLTSLPRVMSLLRLASSDGRDGGKSFSSGLTPPGERLPGQLGIWTPGMDPQPLPDSIASFEWPAGSDLVLQLHLHPSGKAETEQSSVGVYLTDRPPVARFRSVVLLDKKLDIQPGDGRYAVHLSRTLPFPADLYGVFPHMHLIGRTVRVTATLPDATVLPLIAIGDWDFNWQNYYQYATPPRLPAGTRIDADWTFDNSSANAANPSSPPQRVRFGEQTTDEMAALIMDLVPTGASANAKRRGR